MAIESARCHGNLGFDERINHRLLRQPKMGQMRGWLQQCQDSHISTCGLDVLPAIAFRPPLVQPIYHHGRGEPRDRVKKYTYIDRMTRRPGSNGSRFMTDSNMRVKHQLKLRREILGLSRRRLSTLKVASRLHEERQKVQKDIIEIF